MTKLVRSFIIAVLVIILPIIANAQNETAPLLKVAMFVQDKTGTALPENIALLNDVLTAKLTKSGFSIIDRKAVLAKFKEGGIAGEDEEALLSAPAIRIAQALGADWLMLASISAVENESREFIGVGTVYKTNNQVMLNTLQTTVEVIDCNVGGSIYADTVITSERTALVENVKITSANVMNKLINSAAEKIALNISEKAPKIRDAKPIISNTVGFTVESNVVGATIELDGAVIGTTPGNFTAMQGIHQMRISKQWLTTWERTVNILPQQKLHITLELSEEGLQRYTTMEQFNADLAREKNGSGSQGL